LYKQNEPEVSYVFSQQVPERVFYDDPILTDKRSNKLRCRSADNIT